MQGGTAIFNFGTAGNITQNSEAKAREAMRDPDGVYQFDQKVAIVVAAKVDRSRSLITFEAIRSPEDKFNPDRDFQYREYILHLDKMTSKTKGTISGFTSSQYINPECTITGIINSTP
jgi:hypothetical protein